MLNSPSLSYPAKQLKLGDILLLKDKTHNLVRHACVVSYSDPELDKYLAFHEVRVDNQPHALIEACLPPDNILKERNLDLEIFRVKDQKIAEQAVIILRKWMLLATLFGENNIQKCQDKVNSFFQDLFDEPFDKINKKYPTIKRDTKYHQRLKEFSENNHQDFQNHVLEVVKFAARSNLTPFRPDRDDKGFHCFQIMIIAFQVAYVSHLVEPAQKQWVSSKMDVNVRTEKTIKEGYNIQDILQTIPKVFQIRAKYATGDLIEYWFESDQQEVIENLGILEHIDSQRISPYKSEQDKNILRLFEEGKNLRKQLAIELGLHKTLSDIEQKNHLKF